MSLPLQTSFLYVGRIVKTQGIKGEMKVWCPGGKPPALVEGQVVYLENREGIRKPFTVKSSRTHKEASIVSFHGVGGIEEAEKFVGASVYVAKDELKPLPADEFYWHQLLGLTVETEEGTSLGRLEEIFPTGSNDVFVVRKNGEEILLPATDEVVIQVDLEKRVMIVHPLEGMLPER